MGTIILLLIYRNNYFYPVSFAIPMIFIKVDFTPNNFNFSFSVGEVFVSKLLKPYNELIFI